MGNAIAFRADFGVPGAVTREDQRHIEGVPLDPALPFSAYGLPGKIAAGKFVPIAGTGEVVYGYLVRPFPFTGPNASDPLGSATPPTTGVANVLRRGYICVHNGAGAPGVGGAVNIRFQNAVAGKPIGGVEFTATADTYVSATSQFMSQQDASGNAEVFINTP